MRMGVQRERGNSIRHPQKIQQTYTASGMMHAVAQIFCWCFQKKKTEPTWAKSRFDRVVEKVAT